MLSFVYSRGYQMRDVWAVVLLFLRLCCCIIVSAFSGLVVVLLLWFYVVIAVLLLLGCLRVGGAFWSFLVFVASTCKQKPKIEINS